MGCISKFYFTYQTSRDINTGTWHRRCPPTPATTPAASASSPTCAGVPGRDIVSLGLAALRRLAHRGADASFGAVDGCGVLTAIPWSWVTESFGRGSPRARSRGLGMLFSARPIACRRPKSSSASSAWAAPAQSAGARADRPQRRAAAQRDTTPKVLQVVAGFDGGGRLPSAALLSHAARIERIARAAGVRLAIVSLSTRDGSPQGAGHRRTRSIDSTRTWPTRASSRRSSCSISGSAPTRRPTGRSRSRFARWRTTARSTPLPATGCWMRARAADTTALPASP